MIALSRRWLIVLELAAMANLAIGVVIVRVYFTDIAIVAKDSVLWRDPALPLKGLIALGCFYLEQPLASEIAALVSIGFACWAAIWCRKALDTSNYLKFLLTLHLLLNSFWLFVLISMLAVNYSGVGNIDR